MKYTTGPARLRQVTKGTFRAVQAKEAAQAGL